MINDHIEVIIKNFQRDYSNPENPSAFSKIKHSSDNIMCCCPYHSESKPSFGVSKEYPHKFHCFTCGAKGAIESLTLHVYGKLKGLSAYEETERIIAKSVIEERSIGIEKIFNKGGHYVSEEEVEEYKKLRHPYIEGRGLSNKTLIKYEVGYDSKNHSITFPVRSLDGKVPFILRRSVSSKHFQIPEGVDKKEVLYGLYYLNRAGVRKAYITEAPIDTLSCYEARLPSVSVVGKYLFKEQVRLLLRSGIQTVNLFFDNDKWGVDCTLKSFEVLKDTPIKVRVVMFPEGNFGIDGTVKYKDANDLLVAGEMKNVKTVNFENYYMQIFKRRKRIEPNI